jgi:hypothetical protein
LIVSRAAQKRLTVGLSVVFQLLAVLLVGRSFGPPDRTGTPADFFYAALGCAAAAVLVALFGPPWSRRQLRPLQWSCLTLGFSCVGLAGVHTGGEPPAPFWPWPVGTLAFLVAGVVALIRAAFIDEVP